jgi:esterase/lipase superfamily enzyme
VKTRISLLLAALWLLGGCSSAVRLMPTPTLFTSGDPAMFAAGADVGWDPTIEILYATNRLAVGPPGARHYAGMQSNQLRLGVATLKVGDGTKTAEALRTMSTSVVEGERPEITLQNTREMAVLEEDAQAPGPDVAEFFAHVDALVRRGSNRDLLIYVHGANTDFERAAAQAAQFQHFLGRDAVVMVFAWPSAGSLLRYGRDVATTRRSEPVFARLLEQLSSGTQAAHLNVLAYSAGAMIASPALARAAGDAAAATDPARLRLGEVYYAAPDIDFPVIVDNLPRYEDQVRRVTVAVNLSDRALSFAQWRHRVSRAGRPNLAEIGPDETRWLVDASGRDELDVLSIRAEDLPGLPADSHAFWYDHPWVSSDVLLKLRFHAPPPARGLNPNRNESELAFWTFPSDYPQRLPVVVRELAVGQPASKRTSPTQ